MFLRQVICWRNIPLILAMEQCCCLGCGYDVVDMGNWIANKGGIISGSGHESAHRAIIEGDALPQMESICLGVRCCPCQVECGTVAEFSFTVQNLGVKVNPDYRSSLTHFPIVSGQYSVAMVPIQTWRAMRQCSPGNSIIFSALFRSWR